MKKSSLDKNDTRQLLIENSDFVSKVKISKSLKESIQLSKGKADTLIVKNIPCTILNRVNQNGRIYSTQVVQAAIEEAKANGAFEQKSLLSQADEHPESSFVAPSHASHVVINAYIKPKTKIVVEGKREVHDVLFMDWEVLNTQEGKNLRALFEAECSVGTSIRGIGNLRGNQVEDYQLYGCDLVGNPSSSTYTRMPVSESVKVELKNSKDLKETFTVSTSSTNVVRDLEAAASIQEKLDSIGYGTVTKTSTKVDEETDPKTGAQTSITTLEAETSDDVATLDQALSMAKNAMLNGVVNVDSITIENIKEEQPQESVEIPEENELKEEEVIAEYVPEQVVDNMNDVPVTEAKEDEKKDAKEGRKFVLKTPSGFVAMDGNALVFKEDPKEALHFVSGKEESGLIHLSGVEKILDAMGVYDVEKYYRKDTTDISAPNEIATNSETAETDVEEGVIGGALGATAGALAGYATGNVTGALTGASSGYDLGSRIGDAIMPTSSSTSTPSTSTTDDKNDTNTDTTSDTEMEEANGSNTKYSATVNIQGDGKSETSEIAVSATEPDAILSEVGNLWDMKSQSGKGVVDITVTNTETGEAFHYNPETRTLEKINTMQEAGEIEQKNNQLSIQIDDKNKAVKNFDSNAQASVAKAALEKGKISGDVMLDEEGANPGFNQEGWYAYADGVGYTGPYATEEEAMSGLEGYEQFVKAFYVSKEDLNEVLYNEPSEPSDPYVQKPLQDATEDDTERYAKCEWCDEKLPLSNLRKEVDLGYLCNHCIKAIESREGALEFEDDLNEAEATVTVSDIDWDEASVVESLFSEDCDKSNEDLIEALTNLPNEMTVKVNIGELDNPQDVKTEICKAVEKASGRKVNDCNILNIQ